MILQSVPKVKHFGIQKKLLPIEPCVLLREANRRRASLSAGNMFEMFDAQFNLSERWVNECNLIVSILVVTLFVQFKL